VGSGWTATEVLHVLEKQRVSDSLKRVMSGSCTSRAGKLRDDLHVVRAIMADFLLKSNRETAQEDKSIRIG